MKNAGCCGEVPTAELLGAIDQFNRGEWFECHETLEELWVGEKGELKDFYQGVLQLAVALHHWRNGNLKGALILLKSGSDCLSRGAGPGSDPQGAAGRVTGRVETMP